jgi:hypothetical protein
LAWALIPSRSRNSGVSRRDVMADGAIDLDEIAMLEILDPRQV